MRLIDDAEQEISEGLFAPRKGIRHFIAGKKNGVRRTEAVSGTGEAEYHTVEHGPG